MKRLPKHVATSKAISRSGLTAATWKSMQTPSFIVGNEVATLIGAVHDALDRHAAKHTDCIDSGACGIRKALHNSIVELSQLKQAAALAEFLVQAVRR